jgi:polar amino acid transport system permease protein
MSVLRTASREAPAEVGITPIKAVPVRRYGQWLLAAVVALYVAQFFVTMAGNETLDYGEVWGHLFHPTVLKGVLVTFELTIAAGITGATIGTLVAVGKLSDNVIFRTVSGLYTWFFRALPLIALVLILGNFAILFRSLSLGIPFTGLNLFEVDTNAVVTIFVAAWLALALHEGAYMGEAIRGGLTGVPSGQREAAEALGMSQGAIMRRIVLPQALRMIVPPMGNRMIALLKESSIVSVIAGGELMNAVTNLSASNYLVIEMLLVASVWYLACVTVMTYGQRKLEKRFGKGFAR